MARTIRQIQQSIIDAKNADATLVALDSTSNSALWLLWTWVVSKVQEALEGNFDNHKAEVKGIIGTQKPHTKEWYATKAMAYQYGVGLPAGTDVYLVVPPVDPGVLVVSYASVTEFSNYLLIKVAKLTGDVLGPISGGELAGLQDYMHEVKDAGVRLIISTNVGEVLVLVINVFYDGTILDDSGRRLDGTNDTPIADAIKSYLNNINTHPFNGLFVYNNLIASLQAVEGVVIADVVNAQSSAVVATAPFFDCMVQKNPVPGYMVYDDVNSIITYTAQAPI